MFRNTEQLRVVNRKKKRRLKAAACCRRASINGRYDPNNHPLSHPAAATTFIPTNAVSSTTPINIR
ncbi:hypothetical protein, partial [Stenotrophomonas maltophilia]|uniref:hypothetical protein n=1 Tax=Stenotrophomonas maltophilia TaxID=40324 RepID=UPI001953BB42